MNILHISWLICCAVATMSMYLTLIRRVDMHLELIASVTMMALIVAVMLLTQGT